MFGCPEGPDVFAARPVLLNGLFQSPHFRARRLTASDISAVTCAEVLAGVMFR